jgi:Flp pilus assembly protein TadG
MKRLFAYSKGQIFVMYAVAATAMLGAVAMGTDVAIMYFNWASMQRAVDAAALAGANFLPEDTSTASSKATSYATLNGLAGAEVATPTFNAPTNDSITVTASRTVPYYFAKVLGLTNQLIKVTATAQVPASVSCVGCASYGPRSQPTGGASDSGGTQCADTGSCQLIPIGLDWTTPFVTGSPVTFNQASVGAGNWDLIALGGTGGSNFRTNLANGFSGPVAIGDFITTEPGKKKGPITQGFQDRIDQAASIDPTGTFSSHKQNNPRVVVIPMVDWGAINGRSQVPVMAFAHVWLESVSSGVINAYFVEDYVPDSLVSAPASYHGARGNPVLIK